MTDATPAAEPQATDDVLVLCRAREPFRLVNGLHEVLIAIGLGFLLFGWTYFARGAPPWPLAESPWPAAVAI